MEKLDYIQSLGINAIELLPVHEFNELEYYQVGMADHDVSSAMHCLCFSSLS